jgi:hypothetical protein
VAGVFKIKVFDLKAEDYVDTSVADYVFGKQVGKGESGVVGY